MSAIHFGGESVGLKFPICERAPSWVHMTNMWGSVTCKLCLKKKDQIERGVRESFSAEGAQ